MYKNKIKQLTLKKSNLFNREILKNLIFLLVFVFSSNISYAEDIQTQDKSPSEISVIISPSIIKQGDVVTVKILKNQDQDNPPKVFFDKTKYPVFELSEEYFRSLFPITANYKTGKHVLEVFYDGKVKRVELDIKRTNYPLQELRLTKQVAALKASKIEKDLVNKTLGYYSEKKLWTGKFLNPSKAPLSTPYGVQRRVNGVIDPEYFHKGLDFAGKEGSDIIAPEDGIVILSGKVSEGFIVNGNCLFLDHGQNVISAYLHLSKILVKNGDLVKKGQLIGKVGSTGIASGPHLHWGIYISGKTVDPINWTSKVIE